MFKEAYDHVDQINDGLNKAANKLNRGSNGLVVINAGLPRTGTMSFKAAISQLYGAKCYHAIDIFAGNEEDIEVWIRAMDKVQTPEDWKEYFSKNNYVSGCDAPFCIFYKDFMKIYPEAKVVFTTRDFPSWYKSIQTAILPFTQTVDHWSMRFFMKVFDKRKNLSPDFFLRVHNYLRAEGWDMNYQESIEAGPEEAEKFFNAWRAEVVRNVPADRLLLHNARDGWEPLCKFLGMPMPDTPYPWANDASESRKNLMFIKDIRRKITYGLPLTVALLVGGVAYLFFR